MLWEGWGRKGVRCALAERLDTESESWHWSVVVEGRHELLQQASLSTNWGQKRNPCALIRDTGVCTVSAHTCLCLGSAVLSSAHCCLLCWELSSKLTTFFGFPGLLSILHPLSVIYIYYFCWVAMGDFRFVWPTNLKVFTGLLRKSLPAVLCQLLTCEEEEAHVKTVYFVTWPMYFWGSSPWHMWLYFHECRYFANIENVVITDLNQ